MDTARLTRRGLRLAQFTVAYNVVEGLLAVTAGLAAGLVSVVGFGVDSAIESLVAILVAVRLAARLRGVAADTDRLRAERRTLRLVAWAFFALAGYIVVEAVRGLLGDDRPDGSPLAVGVLVASLLVMPVLYRAKRRVGVALADPLILADAAETRICILLSASTLVGLWVYQLSGAAWVDPVAGFVIAAVAVMEGREAWEGELGDDADDG